MDAACLNSYLHMRYKNNVLITLMLALLLDQFTMWNLRKYSFIDLIDRRLMSCSLVEGLIRYSDIVLPYWKSKNKWMKWKSFIIDNEMISDERIKSEPYRFDSWFLYSSHCSINYWYSNFINPFNKIFSL